MKQFRFYILIATVLLFSSCSSLKEGFVNQKKNNSDEFLVEKKSPLVMPQDYNELPIPDEDNRMLIMFKTYMTYFIVSYFNMML